MDPIDIVIESLLKAASTEVVKQGIAAISTRLGSVFVNKNHVEIKKIIEEEHLIEPVAKLAKENLDQSYLLPFRSANEARPHHKVQIFFEVIKFCFRLSKENQMDVLVPGSFLGTGNISLFSSRGGFPNLDLQPLSINFPNSSGSPYYSILPAKNEQEAIAVYSGYKKRVRALRHESDDYVTAADMYSKGNWFYHVEKITAGSVYFNYGTIFPDQHREFLNIGENKATMTDWLLGAKAMISNSVDVPELSLLSKEDGAGLVELLNALITVVKK